MDERSWNRWRLQFHIRASAAGNQPGNQYPCQSFACRMSQCGLSSKISSDSPGSSDRPRAVEFRDRALLSPINHCSSADSPDQYIPDLRSQPLERRLLH